MRLVAVASSASPSGTNSDTTGGYHRPATAAQRQRRVVQLDNVVTLDRKISDLKARLGRVTVRWSGSGMPDAAYEAAVAQLDADLAGLVERRRHAGPAPAVEVDPRELAIRLTELWDDLTVIEKRNLLRPLIHRVRILKPARQGKGVWRDRVDVIPAWGPAAG